jgi:hypothetical protein
MDVAYHTGNEYKVLVIEKPSMIYTCGRLE